VEAVGSLSDRAGSTQQPCRQAGHRQKDSQLGTPAGRTCQKSRTPHPLALLNPELRTWLL
jgi:hypothetical protein